MNFDNKQTLVVSSKGTCLCIILNLGLIFQSTYKLSIIYSLGNDYLAIEKDIWDLNKSSTDTYSVLFHIKLMFITLAIRIIELFVIFQFMISRVIEGNNDLLRLWFRKIFLYVSKSHNRDLVFTDLTILVKKVCKL